MILLVHGSNKMETWEKKMLLLTRLSESRTTLDNLLDENAADSTFDAQYLVREENNLAINDCQIDSILEELCSIVDLQTISYVYASLTSIQPLNQLIIYLVADDDAAPAAVGGYNAGYNGGYGGYNGGYGGDGYNAGYNAGYGGDECCVWDIDTESESETESDSMSKSKFESSFKQSFKPSSSSDKCTTDDGVESKQQLLTKYPHLSMFVERYFDAFGESVVA
jgi:hypothetical protein